MRGAPALGPAEQKASRGRREITSAVKLAHQSSPAPPWLSAAGTRIGVVRLSVGAVGLMRTTRASRHRSRPWATLVDLLVYVARRAPIRLAFDDVAVEGWQSG